LLSYRRHRAGQGLRSTADIFDAHLGLCVSPLYINGNEEQRKKFVTPLAQGKKIGAMAVTESDAGSDVSSVKTTAVRDGDHYILNGSKIFITNGDVCDTVLVFASIPKLAPRGMTAFIVEKAPRLHGRKEVTIRLE